MKKELVLVLDFGGQYNQLIARRVRECNVYCEIVPYTMSLDEILAKKPKGIIFTGGPNSVYDETSPTYDKAIFDAGVPILGICYGCQLMAYKLGGTVATAPVSEYGKTEVGVAQYVTAVQKLTETHTAEAAQRGERSAFHLDCAAALAFAVFDHLRGLAVKARRGPCDGSDKRYGVLS